MSSSIRFALTAMILIYCGKSASAQDTYIQYENLVYTESNGVGLVLDVFEPTGQENGLAIVDVVSGGWSSSRAKINDHKAAQLYAIFCKKGYTVFAIRPGSVSKFTGFEMLSHLQKGIAWVKKHAGEYNVDPDRIGMTGASAGGHLACLAAVAGTADANVSAVGVFFPPTDLLSFAGDDVDLSTGGDVNKLLGGLAFNGRLDGLSRAEIKGALAKLSPARLVTGKEPPFLLIHGDADKVVPLKHSQMMVEALQEKNVPAKLIVKAGGGHPWLTIHEEVAVIADWMDAQLKPTARTSTKKKNEIIDFTRQFDIIYHKQQGYALTMDKVTPVKKNGAAVVMVMSGGWFSSHDSTKPHDATKLPNAFKKNATELLERGYTLFYVVHGTQPKFNIREIHEHISQAVRHIRFHAAEFGLDPQRIGITGGSAGGHLSLMQGTKGKDKSADRDLTSSDDLSATSSRVQAVAAYYPPTDFVNYGNEDVFFDQVVRDVHGGKNPYMQALDFVEFDAANIRLKKVEDKEQLEKHYEFIAPFYHVTEDDAPTLLLHGDADQLVPIQQSERIVAAFQKADVPHKLYLKKGGNHGWPATDAEADMIADWFDLYLAP